MHIIDLLLDKMKSINVHAYICTNLSAKEHAGKYDNDGHVFECVMIVPFIYIQNIGYTNLPSYKMIRTCTLKGTEKYHVRFVCTSEGTFKCICIFLYSR
jgi:hypothetical protein